MRKKLLIIGALFLSLPYIGGHTYAGEIHISQLQEFGTILHALSPRPAVSSDTSLKTRRCISYDRNTYVVVSPECLLQQTLPKLPIEEAVDLALPHVTQVNNFYQIEEKEFYYDQAALEFDEQVTDFLSILNNPNRLLLRLLSNREYLLRIPKVYLAVHQLDNASVYAATRDVSSYGTCRKTNYDLAMAEMDGLLLQPEQHFNMNKAITNLPGYCSGNGGIFLFYQGVCGGSTLAFWNAAINPYLYITKRYNHSKWYAGFYGSNVLGDDASMYEMSKQFEFKNIGEYPVYFRTLKDAQGNITLLSFYPEQTNLITHIEKKQEGPLSARLVSTVYHLANGTLSYQQERVSRYYGIDNETD